MTAVAMSGATTSAVKASHTLRRRAARDAASWLESGIDAVVREVPREIWIVVRIVVDHVRPSPPHLAQDREVLPAHAEARRFVMVELRPGREDDPVSRAPDPQTVVD